MSAYRLSDVRPLFSLGHFWLLSLVLVLPKMLSSQDTIAPCPRVPTGFELMSFVRHLASDDLAGRSFGSLGEWCASSLIAEEYRSLGLEAAGDDDFFMNIPSERAEWPARNVVGVLPSSHPTSADEFVVVGAHHDHIGVKSGQVHPGADDNASGVTALLIMAATLARGPELNRSVLFVTFSGEEAFFQGSRRYIAHPPVPLDHTVAMVNLDMVGRLNSGGLTVSGVGTFDEPIRSLNETDVFISTLEEPARGSDHLQFYRAGIPVLYLTTGSHEDRHKPTDIPEHLNWVGIRRIAAIGAAVVTELANRGYIQELQGR